MVHRFYHAFHRIRITLGPSLVLFMILASSLSTIPSTGRSAEKIEFGLNYGRNGLALETSYLHQYIPPFRFSSEPYTGSASQTLALQGGGSWGLGFSVTFFPSRNFGVQALVNTFTSALEGTSTPLQISLTYTAMPPPDYVPRQFTVEHSQNWPNIVGNFRNTVTSINGLVRIGQGRKISFDLSAGLFPDGGRHPIEDLTKNPRLR